MFSLLFKKKRMNVGKKQQDENESEKQLSSAATIIIPSASAENYTKQLSSAEQEEDEKQLTGAANENEQLASAAEEDEKQLASAAEEKQLTGAAFEKILKRYYDPKNSGWTHPAWVFLHSIADSFPSKPSDKEKKAAELFFKFCLPILLPCSLCGDHFAQETLSNFDASCGENLSTWLYNVHNNVNVRTNKKRLDIDECKREQEFQRAIKWNNVVQDLKINCDRICTVASVNDERKDKDNEKEKKAGADKCSYVKPFDEDFRRPRNTFAGANSSTMIDPCPCPNTNTNIDPPSPVLNKTVKIMFIICLLLSSLLILVIGALFYERDKNNKKIRSMNIYDNNTWSLKTKKTKKTKNDGGRREDSDC